MFLIFISTIIHLANKLYFLFSEYVPHVNIPFEYIQGNKIMHPKLNIYLNNGASLVSAKYGKALNLDGRGQYADMDDQSGTCMGNLERCNHGLMTSFYVYPRELRDNTYLLSSGPYSIFQRNGKTVVEFKTRTKTWTVASDAVKKNQWQHVEVSWHPERGLELYVNKTRVAYTQKPTTHAARPVASDYKIYIGRTSDMRGKNYANAMIDEVEFWNSPREFIVAHNMWPKGNLRGFIKILYRS